MECYDHGGRDFKSDCWICKAKQTLKDNEGAIERRDKVIATQAAAIEALEEKILAAVKVHDDRAEQVEGFANKTASDMRAALIGENQ